MYEITLVKTLARRVHVESADDFESASEWAAAHWDEVGFGEGTLFWVEVLDDYGAEAVVTDGVEG